MKKEEEVVDQSVIYSYLPNSDQQQFANVFRIDEEEECSLYVLLAFFHNVNYTSFLC